MKKKDGQRNKIVLLNVNKPIMGLKYGMYNG